MAAIWGQAKAKGLVTGEPRDWLDSVVFQISGKKPLMGGPEMKPAWASGISQNDYNAIRDYLASNGSKPIAEAQALCFDQPLVESLARVQRDSVRYDWGETKVEEEVKRVGRMFGSEGMDKPEATMAQKYYQREILNGSANGALQAGRTTDEHRKLFPYMRYLAGANPRPNHAALDGFVWRAGHSIEDVVIPPNGWACNCRVVPISYADAEARGWRTDFPAGTGALSEFLAMGGADEGFPKGSFVDGLPNSIAGC